MFNFCLKFLQKVKLTCLLLFGVFVRVCVEHKPSASIQTFGTSATPRDLSDLMDYRSAASLVSLLGFRRKFL